MHINKLLFSDGICRYMQWMLDPFPMSGHSTMILLLFLPNCLSCLLTELMNIGQVY